MTMLKCLKRRVLSAFSFKNDGNKCKCLTSLAVFSDIEDDKVLNQLLAIREHCKGLSFTMASISSLWFYLFKCWTILSSSQVVGLPEF